MDDDNWKSDLGFLERLDIINKLTQPLSSRDPTLPHAQIAQQAWHDENQCRDKARSKTEYNQLWSTRLEELQTTSSAIPAPNDQLAGFMDNQPAPVDIGPYSNAVPFASGLFSTLYRYCRSSTPAGQTSTGGHLALKVTDMFAIQPPHDPVREARLLKTAAGHANILSCWDDFRLSSSSFVLVSPYYQFTLATLLEDKKITGVESRKVILDVFCGLAHLHSLGILHRDVKPSNILLSSLVGPAILADFGIAWSPNDPSSERTEEKISDVGTTCYRAPELLFGYRGYGEGIDIWAAGCALAECLDLAHEPFFDAGDLGSELRLIASIFQKLGTPTSTTWPEATNFPDFGKLSFVEYPKQPWEELLPHGNQLSRELLSHLLTYESTKRLSAAQAAAHPYFDSVRDGLQ